MMARPKILVVSGLIVAAMVLCKASLSESTRILPRRGREGGPPVAGYSYTTTGTGEIPPMSKGEVNWSKGSTYADISLIFDSQAKLQKILGFGGAFTEASAYNYKKLSKPDRERVMQMYFGAEGNRYNMGRIPMGSCDFSTKTYSFDNGYPLPGTEDPQLKGFDDKASVDLDNGIIPLILDALSTVKAADGDDVLLFGSPWSPPPWMKAGDHAMVGSELPCLKPGMDKVWAGYFLRWVKAYMGHGIKIWGVTAQNEPGFVDNTAWEACSFTAEGQRDFIRDHLGPAMNSTGVKVIAYDDDKSQLKEWSDTILGDPATAPYVWGMGLHWYFGDLVDNMAYVRDKYPNASQLATEGCTCVYDQKEYNDSWARAHRYVHDAITDLNTGVVGWIDWNLLLDISGPGGTGGPNHANNTCFAHVHVTEDSSLVIHDSFWAFGHLSRFIPRGSWVVKHSLIKGAVDGVEGLVVSLPDSGLAAVLTNNDRSENATSKTVRLRDAGWLDCIVFEVPPLSVVTVVLHPAVHEQARRRNTEGERVWDPVGHRIKR